MGEHSPDSYQPAIITNNVKILMTFIDRVGFPVLAFLLMFWLVIHLSSTITKLNETMISQTEILRDVKAAMNTRR